MKERKVIPVAKSRIVLRCLPFLLSFVLLFVPALSVNAASSNQTLIDSRAHYNNSQTQTYSLQYYKSTDQVNLVQNGSYGGNITGTIHSTSADTHIFHIKHEFGAIGYMGLDNHTFDAFRIQSHVAGRYVNVTSTNTYEIEIANINPYMKLNASGHEYRSNIDYADFYIDSPITGNFTIIPCVEYDLIVKLYSASYDMALEIESVTASFNMSDGSYNVYGINYTSTGEGGIIAAINNLLNGFSSNTMPDASDNFASGSGELNTIESTLGESSSDFIDTYSGSAFDASFLDQIGSSLTYVATWFTNFWNIGGGLTATFTVSFAIFIAFYIIRVRS